MNEDYTHFGTVRRRPRTGHQRSQPHEGNGNGKAPVNGSNGNMHDGFERDDYYDRGDRAGDIDDQAEENERPRRERSRRRQFEDERPRRALPNSARELDLEPPLFRLPFDPWRLYGAARRNLLTIFTGGALLAIVGFFLGAFLIDYKITVPLIRKTPNAVHTEGALPNVYTPYQLSDGTLYAFMKAGEVMQRVAKKAAVDPSLAPLKITPWDLAKGVSVTPSPNPDWVFLTIKNPGNLRVLPELANLYAQEAVEYMREVQRNESIEINKWLQRQVGEEEKKLADLRAQLKSFSSSGLMGYDREVDQDLKALDLQRGNLEAKKTRYDLLGAQIDSLAKLVPDTRLEQEELELQNLLIRLGPKHPSVIDKQQFIEGLKKQREQAKGKPPSSVGTSPLPLRAAELKAERDGLEREIEDLGITITNIEKRLNAQGIKGVAYEIKNAEFESAKKRRDVLIEKERESRLFVDNSLGYFGVMNPASADNIGYRSRWIKVTLLGLVAGFLGLFLCLGVVLLTEVLDTTLRTAEDIKRIAKLPVLAKLGDLRKMSAAAQVDWAFRTLTTLKGKLSRSADQSLVCGIISANHGEGRSTWVNLLVSAASQRGLRVLTVDTRPTATAPRPDQGPTEPREPSAPQRSEGTKAEPNRSKTATETERKTERDTMNLPDQPITTLGMNVLNTPATVAEQLEAPNAQPVVHIPLPGWAWNLERRKQWQKALEYWRKIDDLVIFVELPPACESEAILLAEHLPQLIWLVGSGMADSAETITHLETLRNARCKLVGAVLNQAPPPFFRGRIARWFGRAAAVIFLAFGVQFGSYAAQSNPPASELEAATANQPKVQTLAFSANAKHKRAQWQEHLTLGPGDVVDIHLFSNSVFTALSRTNVFIGPYGRINYLYASGIPAAGLTIEELRQKIAEALTPYYNQPPTIVVVPVSFNSKKYFMLGKVNAKGAYVLDRPLTLIEAVARAHGLETGLYQHATVEMTDLGRSFLIRNGQKASIDFEKLFAEGDLSQNAMIEPNDYIYFASTGANEIYILGEVVSPGPIGFVPNATVVTAITDRGGFTDRAYKRRVLVVRGSLNEPETFVVDSGGVLDGRVRDFRLEPRDIVYVGHRPWILAEDLLDEAAGAFIEGAMTAWAGASFSPLLNTRLLPKIR